ncbi:hypothetical protein EI53_00217 [Fusobacterium naviforme]|nr:hypothetical protein EI53_00217 [Fusobacterium naviforme]
MIPSGLRSKHCNIQDMIRRVPEAHSGIRRIFFISVGARKSRKQDLKIKEKDSPCDSDERRKQSRYGRCRLYQRKEYEK